MNALNRKPPRPVTTIHSICESCGFCSRCGCIIFSKTPSRDLKCKTKDTAPPTSVFANGAGYWQPGSSNDQSRVEKQESHIGANRESLSRRGWVLFPSQLAPCQEKSACQSLICCLLKNKYLRDSQVSMMCIVFIQTDITTTQRNSYLINLQSFDLILLIKCYC